MLTRSPTFLLTTGALLTVALAEFGSSGGDGAPAPVASTRTTTAGTTPAPTPTTPTPTAPTTPAATSPTFAGLTACTALPSLARTALGVTGTTAGPSGFGPDACTYRIAAGESYQVTLADATGAARFTAVTGTAGHHVQRTTYHGFAAVTGTRDGADSECLVAVTLDATHTVVVAGTDTRAPSVAIVCEDTQIVAGDAVTGVQTHG